MELHRSPLLSLHKEQYQFQAPQSRLRAPHQLPVVDHRKAQRQCLVLYSHLVEQHQLQVPNLLLMELHQLLVVDHRKLQRQ